MRQAQHPLRAAVLGAWALFLAIGSAHAQTATPTPGVLAVKDANGANQNTCQLTVGGVLIPCHVEYVWDGTNYHALLSDTSGRPIVNINGTVTTTITGSVPLPANAAQETGGHLAAVDTNTANAATDIGAPGSTACATDNGSCNANALLQRLNQRVTSMIAALGSPLQAGGSVSVTGSVAVTGTFWQATQPVSGTFWQSTQPVSAASLPLPSGAATAANQAALNGDGGALAHVTNWPATQPVSLASAPLASNAAQEAGGNLATAATNTGTVATELGATSSPATGTVNKQLGSILTALGSPFQAGGSIGNAALSAATPATCSALCSNLVAKASAGTLYSFNVAADSTLSGAAWWIMVFNATTLPADGAVTPIKCYAEPSGVTNDGRTFAAGGITLSTGITIGVSTTGCFTKTASTHADVEADYQ